MTAYFRRQLIDYVEYHRDPWNCAAHVFGIIVLFLGAVLPLTMLRLPGFGGHVTLAMLLALPVLIYWLALDPALGLAILCSAIALLSIAAAIVANVSAPAVWALTVVLVVLGIAAQVVGHSVFERRKASMADHPAHFLLGPMFVMAKLFIAFGFRHDLAAIISPGAEPVPAGYPGNR
ncbi:Mpo1-like protein [Bradyrhizobium sp. Tv2a-2]|uniref:Mpo1 family 2-hydroxy fatty acid dioxygenase n=1 Tax=Bradyrhizobium sp. Tv2a-2 TaxID=113395 RepID=UPI0003F5B662|nr:Mpo1-like protein [Bradyrhizobium sp. Tv2a-2]